MFEMYLTFMGHHTRRSNWEPFSIDLIYNWNSSLARAPDIPTIIQAEIPLTNNMHEPVALPAGRSQSRTTLNEQAAQHRRLLPRRCCSNHGSCSAWCASATHFTLRLRSVCQGNFCLNYRNKVESYGEFTYDTINSIRTQILSFEN